MKRIAVTLIATNKYRQFVQPLLEGIEKNFLRNHKVDVHLFTNELFPALDIGRITVIQHQIPAYKFPFATLYRYKTFNEHKEHLSSYDYLVYLDADTAIEQEVPDSFLGEVIAVRHPGFFLNQGWGSYNVHPESTAFLAQELWKKYYCGGTQGGQTDKYLEICRVLAENIAIDESRGILAEHNDESHWVKFTNDIIHRQYPDWKIHELDPSYCSVPSMHQRQMWGIDQLPAIIIALDKNHAEVRS